MEGGDNHAVHDCDAHKDDVVEGWEASDQDGNQNIITKTLLPLAMKA